MREHSQLQGLGQGGAGRGGEGRDCGGGELQVYQYGRLHCCDTVCAGVSGCCHPLLTEGSARAEAVPAARHCHCIQAVPGHPCGSAAVGQGTLVALLARLFWILERMLYIVCIPPLCCVVLAWGGVRHCHAALLSPGLLPGSRQLTLLSWSFSLSLYDGGCVVVGSQCSEDAASFRSERGSVLRMPCHLLLHAAHCSSSGVCHPCSDHHMAALLSNQLSHPPQWLVSPARWVSLSAS